MDFIRSAYSVDFKFGEGNDTLSRIVWWFPPPGTPFYPFPTCMRSLNWWDKQGEPAKVGEVWPGNRKWSNGATIPNYGYEFPCGSAEQFEDGVSSPPPPTPPRDANGVPDCCQPTPPPVVSCVPWHDGRRAASWPGVTNVDPSFGPYDTQNGWYEPSTLDGFYWFKDFGPPCLGAPTTSCFWFLNNTVGGQGPCSPLTYDPGTGGSTWQVPLGAGYRPGAVVSIGPVLPCFPWAPTGITGVPHLTAGGIFTNAVPDLGDWFAGWFWYADPGQTRGFQLTTDFSTLCLSSTMGFLGSFDFNLSLTVFNAKTISWVPGTLTATWLTDPASVFLPSTSAVVVVM